MVLGLTARYHARQEVFQQAAKELGKAATVTLTANGKKLAEGQVLKTIPATISIQEGMDIGMDVGSPVDFTYKLPLKFTGKIVKVTYGPDRGRKRRSCTCPDRWREWWTWTRW